MTQHALMTPDADRRRPKLSDSTSSLDLSVASAPDDNGPPDETTEDEHHGHAVVTIVARDIRSHLAIRLGICAAPTPAAIATAT